MINKGLFTSNTLEWETPQYLFDQLNEEFNFVLDVCARPSNTKVKHNFYNVEYEDALLMNWKAESGYKWMNPPYGREIGKWIKKAAESGNTVCLLPARTDTKWFHEWIYQTCEDVEIRFLKGRLKFGNSKNSAPFPSMVVIF